MNAKDACALLDGDHQKVERLFAEYDAATGSPKKSRLAQSICMELIVHATIEEEIFYPALRKAAGDTRMVDKAQAEHREARDLISQIEDARDMDPLMATLRKAVEHHVREEREEMFPKARSIQGLDLAALAVRLESRKAELMVHAG